MAQNAALSFDTIFKTNALIIIDALSGDDFQTARHLEEDLQDAKLSVHLERRPVGTVEQLEEVLDDVLTMSRQGVCPILHFEGHGSEKGFFVSKCAMIDWKWIVNKLRLINVSCGNNLGVTIGACNGLHAVEPIEITSPTPFHFLIAPPGIIESGYVRDCMLDFYLTLAETQNLTTAMEKIDGKFVQYHCERHFVLAFSKYLKNAVVGKKGKQRVEERLTKWMSSTPFSQNRHLIGAKRSEIKRKLKDQQAKYDYIAKIFLMRKCSVDIGHLLCFARNPNTGL